MKDRIPLQLTLPVFKYKLVGFCGWSDMGDSAAGTFKPLEMFYIFKLNSSIHEDKSCSFQLGKVSDFTSRIKEVFGSVFVREGLK